MFNVSSPNEILTCSKCKNQYFTISGFQETDTTLRLFLTCDSCGDFIAWYSDHAIFTDKAGNIIKCPHCSTEMIKIIGKIDFEKDNKHMMIMQCIGYIIDCRFHSFRIQNQPLKIRCN